jgi:hypothetical protein
MITVSQNGSEASGEPGAHVKAVVGLAANRMRAFGKQSEPAGNAVRVKK